VIEIRDARTDELQALSELCLRSKAMWGYDQDFLTACKDELLLQAEDLKFSQIVIAELSAEIAGIAQVKIESLEAHLLKMFVEPTCLKNGIGSALFDWARETSKTKGATKLIIESDPNAAEFYRLMGARDTGLTPSGSIPGRMLPKLVYDLT
jgi:GNAT superfamily N-acetyltransferase